MLGTKPTLVHSSEMDQWFFLLEGGYLYMGMSFLLIGGAFGLPIPEDLPLVFGGVLVHQDRASGGILFLVCYLSILIGDLIIYAIGYKFGFSLFQTKFLRHKIPPDRVRTITVKLERHAITMIFLARHLFYLRTATILACGTFRMSLPRFMIIDAAAAFVSTALMISLGYLAAEHLPQLFQFIEGLKTFSLVVGVIVVVALATLICRHRRRVQLEALSMVAPTDSSDSSV